jgi:hypothetical protein
MLNEWVAGCAIGLDGSAIRLNLWLCYWIGWQCHPIEFLAVHIECLAVQTECVAGCAHCLKVWQCQLSASLGAHIA